MTDQDPVGVVNALIEAENALDVETATRLFARDAVVTLPTGVLSTPEQIREWQTGLAHGHFHAEIGEIQTDGDRATFTGTVGFDPFRGMGIDAMGSEWEITVDAGRISKFGYNFSPEGLARLQAATARADPSTSTPEP
jgi:SnoaL-like domain